MNVSWARNAGAAATLAAVRRELPREAAEGAGRKVERSGKRTGNRPEATQGVPRWREAHPEWVHRRGKWPTATRKPPISQVKRTERASPTHGRRDHALARKVPSETAMSATELLKTPLHALHLELGAKMVEFAGYEMPVNYPGGIIAEHKHCRESASLFDVSHMGQVRLTGPDAARALESLVPVDVIDLGLGKQRYAFFTNSAGGILDDLMITRRETDLLL